MIISGFRADLRKYLASSGSDWHLTGGRDRAVTIRFMSCSNIGQILEIFLFSICWSQEPRQGPGCQVARESCSVLRRSAGAGIGVSPSLWCSLQRPQAGQCPGRHQGIHQAQVSC